MSAFDRQELVGRLKKYYDGMCSDDPDVFCEKIWKDMCNTADKGETQVAYVLKNGKKTIEFAQRIEERFPHNQGYKLHKEIIHGQKCSCTEQAQSCDLCIRIEFASIGLI